MLEIKSPITGERLQVAENDFEEQMNWQQAKSTCNDLGNGWRLPTKSELELMCGELHQRGIGNFQDDYYWSSSEEESSKAWTFAFYDGHAFSIVKDFTTYVRAVRAI